MVQPNGVRCFALFCSVFFFLQNFLLNDGFNESVLPVPFDSLLLHDFYRGFSGANVSREVTGYGSVGKGGVFAGDGGG